MKNTNESLPKNRIDLLAQLSVEEVSALTDAEVENLAYGIKYGDYYSPSMTYLRERLAKTEASHRPTKAQFQAAFEADEKSLEEQEKLENPKYM